MTTAQILLYRYPDENMRSARNKKASLFPDWLCAFQAGVTSLFWSTR
ncbi:TPA: hypothetical protein ACGJPB_003939 [Escherichia coli]|nr:hypothetical protein [Escherichia sp. Marseille-Q3837]EYD81322.1 hypothetical protein AC26_4068 [Escherichia coli 1-176-05_S3_C2]WGM51183.1 hypothetical protein OSH18_12955 [Escherichia ruysiae]HAL9678538.1 hypothetical protein [Escherichia coli]HAV7815158.1 hypothetical protein [Escherichia coli]HAW5068345.1 hypothetical protein [Escherichia coli]